jgi:hypothetical protein
MDLRFHIDPATELPHIYDHNVTEQEVEEVLRNPGEKRRGSENSRIAIGQTTAGRYLRVVYVPDEEEDGVFVITAYQLEGKPKAAYRRRRKKRKR